MKTIRKHTVAIQAMAGFVALLGASVAQAQSLPTIPTIRIAWINMSSGGVSAVPVGGGLAAALLALTLLAVGMWVMHRTPAAQRMLGVLAVVGVLAGVAADRNAQAAAESVGLIDLVSPSPKLHTEPDRVNNALYATNIVTNKTGGTIKLTEVEVLFHLRLYVIMERDEVEMPNCKEGLILAAGDKCRLTVLTEL